MRKYIFWYLILYIPSVFSMENNTPEEEKTPEQEKIDIIFAEGQCGLYSKSILAKIPYLQGQQNFNNLDQKKDYLELKTYKKELFDCLANYFDDSKNSLYKNNFDKYLETLNLCYKDIEALIDMIDFLSIDTIDTEMLPASSPISTKEISSEPLMIRDNYILLNNNTIVHGGTFSKIDISIPQDQIICAFHMDILITKDKNNKFYIYHWRSRKNSLFDITEKSPEDRHHSYAFNINNMKNESNSKIAIDNDIIIRIDDSLKYVKDEFDKSILYPGIKYKGTYSFTADEKEPPSAIAINAKTRLVALAINKNLYTHHLSRGVTLLATDHEENNKKNNAFSINSDITALAFNKDGNILAIGMKDGAIKVLTSTEATWNVSHYFRKHEDMVTALYFNDSTLTSGGSDKTIRKWDLMSDIKSNNELINTIKSVIENKEDLQHEQSCRFQGLSNIMQKTLRKAALDSGVNEWVNTNQFYNLKSTMEIKNIPEYSGEITCEIVTHNVKNTQKTTLSMWNAWCTLWNNRVIQTTATIALGAALFFATQKLMQNYNVKVVK